jgi:tetratricopeptide (TPR) repeat protein
MRTCRACGGSIAARTGTSLYHCERCDRSFFGEDVDALSIGTVSLSGEASIETLHLPLAFRNRYQLREPLGEGATARVVSARASDSGQLVAIKLFARKSDPNALARFIQEAELAAAIRHSNVVRLLEASVLDHHPFLVYEYLPGGSLRQRLLTGPLAIPDAVNIILECLSGLEACHVRGIVHRDLKPENILFDATGRAQVGDLGMAKDYGSTAPLTQTGMILGTPRYMSPEQWRGEAAVVASDIYAIGLIFYEMLCGCLPFPTGVIPTGSPGAAPDVPWPNGAVPASLRKLIQRSLAPLERDRPASADELASLIRRDASGVYSGSGAVEPRDRFPAAMSGGVTSPGQGPARPVLVVVLVGFLAVAALWSTSRETHARFMQRVAARGQAGDGTAVFRLLREGCPEHRECPTVLVSLGALCLDRDEVAAAVHYFRRAAQGDPPDAVALMHLAVCPQVENSDQRLAHARAALRARPGDPLARLIVASVLAEKGDRAEAARQIPTTYPGEVPGFFTYEIWGDTLRNLGRLAEAEQFYRNGVKAHHRWGGWRSGLAHILLLEGKTDDAGREYFEQLSDLIQQDSHQLLYLDRLVQRLQTVAVAKGPQLGQKQATLFQQLVMTLLERGNVELAVTVFAGQKPPPSVEATQRLMYQLLARNHTTAALRLCRETVRIDPGSASVQRELLSLLATRQDRQILENACRDLLRCRVVHPDVYRRLGQLLMESGRVQEGMGFLARYEQAQGRSRARVPSPGQTLAH